MRPSYKFGRLTKYWPLRNALYVEVSLATASLSGNHATNKISSLSTISISSKTSCNKWDQMWEVIAVHVICPCSTCLHNHSSSDRIVVQMTFHMLNSEAGFTVVQIDNAQQCMHCMLTYTVQIRCCFEQANWLQLRNQLARPKRQRRHAAEYATIGGSTQPHLYSRSCKRLTRHSLGQSASCVLVQTWSLAGVVLQVRRRTHLLHPST